MSAAQSPSLLQPVSSDLTLTACKQESRVDSRLLASHLGNRHRHVMALIEKYAESFASLGKVLFQKAPSIDSLTGQRERFALLNEDQAFFLLTLSRNNARVVELKVKLIQAFSEARQLTDQRQTEYLPTYRQLHAVVHKLAGDSANEKFVHMNLNKLVNKTAGVEPGQRSKAALPQQAMLIVAQAVATQAMQGAADHHNGYQLAKHSLGALAAVVNVQRLGLNHGGQ